MSFHGFLCDSMPTSLVGSRRFLLYDHLSVVSRSFYPSIMYIMSQSPPSYLRIDTLSPSASTIFSRVVALWHYIGGDGDAGPCYLIIFDNIRKSLEKGSRPTVRDRSTYISNSSIVSRMKASPREYKSKCGVCDSTCSGPLVLEVVETVNRNSDGNNLP